MTPLKINLGWQPESPQDILSVRNGSQPQIDNDFQFWLKASLNDSNSAFQFVQARQSAHSSQHYQIPTYFLSWKLSATAAAKAKPSNKLGAKFFEPFKILELNGENSIRVELPKSINILPILHVDHTALVRQ